MLVLCSIQLMRGIFLYAIISDAANRLLYATFSVHDSQPYIATGQTRASKSSFFISRLSDLLFENHSRDFIVDLAMPNRALISVLHSPDSKTMALIYTKWLLSCPYQDNGRLWKRCGLLSTSLGIISSLPAEDQETEQAKRRFRKVPYVAELWEGEAHFTPYSSSRHYYYYYYY